MKTLINYFAGGAVVLGLLFGFEALLAKLGVDASVGAFVTFAVFAMFIMAMIHDYGWRKRPEDHEG